VYVYSLLFLMLQSRISYPNPILGLVKKKSKPIRSIRGADLVILYDAELVLISINYSMSLTLGKNTMISRIQ